MTVVNPYKVLVLLQEPSAFSYQVIKSSRNENSRWAIVNSDPSGRFLSYISTGNSTEARAWRDAAKRLARGRK